MDKTYIMLKDSPVLEINHYTCRILDYGLLPYSLRYPDVSFDDVMHGWTEARTMNIGKTNAKRLLAGLGIRHIAAWRSFAKIKQAQNTHTRNNCSGNGRKSMD